MSAAIHRPRPIDDHPVSRKKYLIPTPSIDAFYERVRCSIRYGRTGDMVYGMTGFGKTSAIRYIRKCLATDYPRLVTLKLLCRKSKAHSEDSFFAHFLTCAGHESPNAGTIAKKRHRLKQFLLERVERSKRNTLCIFPDEAQRLDVLEFEWLRDVYDEIDEAGVRVLVFPVGQPDLLNQKNAFRESRNMQIVGRFMTREHAFRGLTNVDDVATCLAGYDGNCFPENSDWTYTRFYFPRAYLDGLRLVDSATDLWDAFAEAHRDAGFTSDLEISMKFFSLAVGIALLANSEHDAADFRFTPGLWQEAVEECDYVSAQESVRLVLPDAEDAEEADA